MRLCIYLCWDLSSTCCPFSVDVLASCQPYSLTILLPCLLHVVCHEVCLWWPLGGPTLGPSLSLLPFCPLQCERRSASVRSASVTSPVVLQATEKLQGETGNEAEEALARLGMRLRRLWLEEFCTTYMCVLASFPVPTPVVVSLVPSPHSSCCLFTCSNKSLLNAKKAESEEWDVC